MTLRRQLLLRPQLPQQATEEQGTQPQLQLWPTQRLLHSGLPQLARGRATTQPQLSAEPGWLETKLLQPQHCTDRCRLKFRPPHFKPQPKVRLQQPCGTLSRPELGAIVLRCTDLLYKFHRLSQIFNLVNLPMKIFGGF